MADGPSQPESQDPKGNIGQWLWGLIILIVLVAVLVRTSAPPLIDDEEQIPPIAASQPTEDQAEPTTAPASTQPVDAPFKTEVSVNTPLDLQTGWLRIVEQTKTDEQSRATARYRHENEFDVQTRNTNRFEIDLAALPVNRTKRFIMHIDGQDMLLFPEHIGVIGFERSAAGTWEYEKD